MSFSGHRISGDGILASLLWALAPALSFPVLLLYLHGHPRNWWRGYFGHTVYCDTAALMMREMSGEDSREIQAEVHQWVEYNIKGRWQSVTPYSYKFLRKGDAVMFKLRWG